MTSSPIADLNDTLLPWASATEAHLATELTSLGTSTQRSDVEIFVDITYSGDKLERLTRFFGTFLQRQIAAGADEARLLEACPGLTVATLLYRAANLNEISDIDAEYWTGLGLDPTPERQALIHGNYATILSRAGLDPMDSAAQGADGEVGRLFAHIGIATDWLPELIELIDTRRMEGDAAASASEEALALAEILAREPIQMGPLCAARPDIAQHLLEPIVALLRHAADNPEDWEYTVADFPLPPLIAEDLIEELRERPVGTVNRRHSVGVAHRERRPRIGLDYERNRVVLRLPSRPLDDRAGAEVRWRIDADGRPSAFRIGRSDHPSRVESEIRDLPIRRITREIAVRNIDSDEHWTLPVVNSEDPVLVFTTRGVNLTDVATLHHHRVLVVCPADAQPIDPVTDAPIAIVAERPMKTWDGWVIRELDLSDALALHLQRPGQHSPSLIGVRAVDHRQRVRFLEPEAPLAGIDTATGKQVFSTGLQVEFPPTISGTGETWYLSVSAYAGPGESGQEVSEEEPLEVPAEGGVFEVFDPEAYDSPWVGEYLVRLRGPRNESFRHEYALIEGLRVDTSIDGPSSQTRLPVTAGLSPTTVRLIPGEKPFDSIAPITLGPDRRYAMAVVETDAGDALPIAVSVPRIRYQLTLRGEDPCWRTEAMTLASAWIDTATKFRIRPGAELGDPRIVIRNHHGSPVRTLTLSTVDTITYSADLAPAAPSLRLLSRGAIELEFVDNHAGRRVSVRLARIIADPDFSITLDDAGILALHAADTDAAEELPEDFRSRVALWLWPTTAPWEQARTCRIGEALPEDLRDAGPLAAQLFCTDRFDDLRAPLAPGPLAQVLQADSTGYVGAAEGGPWAEVSAFLAGQSEVLPTDSETLSTLWDVQAGWLHSSLDAAASGSAEDERTATASLSSLSQALTHNARQSIHAMARSLVPASDRPAQVIATGLVHSPFVSPEDTPAPITGYSDTPWIAALEILGELSTVPEGSPEASALRAALQDVAGAPILRTLDTGRDASLDRAFIDATTVQIAHMDPAQQKAVLAMFFGGASLVPGAVSEDNSRLMAVYSTFEQREALSELMGDPTLMTTTVSVLRRIKQTQRQLYLAARVRLDKLDGVDTDNALNRWALAPTVSIVCALATRMHAHGHMDSVGKLPQAYPGWAAMSHIVPDLVTSDLVMADAMVLGTYGPSIEDDDMAL